MAFPPPTNLNVHAHTENTVWFMKLHNVMCLSLSLTDPGLADTIVANHHSPIYSEPPDSASPYQHTLDVLQVGVVSV